MQKHLLYINLFAISSVLALSACSDEVENAVTPDMPEVGEKTPIELSVGGLDGFEAPLTRAVITDGTGKTLRAFSANTRVYTVMKAEKTDATTKWAMTWGTAAGINEPQVDSKSALTFAPAQQLYWDDAYARDTELSIYGLAIANKEGSSATIGNVENYSFWNTTTNDLSCSFSLPDQFTTANIYDYDVCYSNNLSGTIGSNKGPLIFHTDTKKFDKDKNMIFYHAMCLLKINIYVGDGFTLTQKAVSSIPTDEEVAANNFVFKNFRGNNIALNGFNKSGKFNIGSGEWTEATVGNFVSIDNPGWPIGDRSDEAKEGTKPVYTLFAQLIPGTDLTQTKDDALDFTIDGNQYKISMKTLYNAIKDKKDDTHQYLYRNGSDVVDEKFLEDGKKLKQGVQYEFSFSISKTKIQNISAQVADWGEVTAEEVFPSNARITLTVEDRTSNTTAVTSNMSIYRTLDKASGITDSHTGFKWDKTYVAATTPSFKVANDNPLIPAAHWETEWFWDSNDSYYHFRTLSPSGKELNGNDSKTFVELSSSNATNADSYDPIAWGAPFKDVADTYKFFYNWDKGFDATSLTDEEASDTDESTHQIYKAIGPTKDQIKILMFHMMSGVHFAIKTTDQANKVELCKTIPGVGDNPDTYIRPTVQLVGYKPTGKVYLGNGLVEADGVPTTTEVAGINCVTTTTGLYGNQEYYYSAVPQPLTDVKLYITTPDHNQYIVDLENAVADISTTDKEGNLTNYNIANPYSETSENSKKYIINSWYPGFRYNYTFTLKKTGIDNLKVTIADWETVNVEEEIKIK